MVGGVNTINVGVDLAHSMAFNAAAIATADGVRAATTKVVMSPLPSMPWKPAIDDDFAFFDVGMNVVGIDVFNARGV